MMSKSRVFRFNPRITLVLLMLVLAFSWMVLFWMGGIVTWGLAPYDTTPLAHRLPQGTWQRELSGFFQSPLGSVSPSIFIVDVSAVLFIIACGRISDSTIAHSRLAVGFALSNFMIAAVMFLGGFIVADLPLESAPYPGYGWTVKFLVSEILLLGLLFTLQAWVIPRMLMGDNGSSHKEAGRFSLGSCSPPHVPECLQVQCLAKH